MKSCKINLCAALLLTWMLSGTIQAQSPDKKSENLNLTTQPFGKMPDGRTVTLYKVSNANGLTAQITDYGAILVSLRVPDHNGNLDDIVLGFDDLDSYLKRNPLFGATVGRYANRIEHASFTLDNIQYKLTQNSGKNHIHGGKQKRFDKVLWNAKPFSDKNQMGVALSYFSKDGEEGFPGNLNCTVTYTLTNSDELKIHYQAATDKPTIINLTNHTYFNLAGAGNGDVLDHQIMINADYYTPSSKTLIPTGEIHSVKDTPLDFTKLRAIGERIDQLTQTRGYDHNYVLKNTDGSLILAARVYEPTSGRVMEVHTTEPGMQFYTANGMKDKKGKNGKTYNNHAGFCLETQHFPDSPNKPHFPSTILRPGQKYNTTTIFKFFKTRGSNISTP